MTNIAETSDPREEYSQEDIAKLAFKYRDCRLELLRLRDIGFSDEQLHRLQQLDYRLQMVLTGNAVIASIPSGARRVITAFKWEEPNIDPSLEFTDT